MKRQSVTSSNIKSIWYDTENHILEVEFINSGIYQYSWVSQWVYQSLLSAGSVGPYFSSNIKNQFTGIKVS